MVSLGNALPLTNKGFDFEPMYNTPLRHPLLFLCSPLLILFIVPSICPHSSVIVYNYIGKAILSRFTIE